jgi:transcriptional regulator with XRE-family HTH domain
LEMSAKSTAPPAANGFILFTVPLTLLVGVSTGGIWPTYGVGTGGSINQYNLPDVARVERGARGETTSAADDIDYIKTHLKLTTTELAKYLGVSRQAVYDWRAGAHVKSHNISKLENLRAAATTLDGSGLMLSAVQIKRKLAGGRTLLETIASGGNGYEAAQSLLSMLMRESEQQKGRLAKIRGRKPITDSEFSPGMVALQESG